ncbi:hypothetical protein NP233_g12930 [Leucocoprinus birnbaumii]|uniref:Uncharacterized protein n=1 Tax=Leucocoprinus birnbaumii TaxID=56174 RepID=A0AAD5VEV5_9AGAR|nr:hypothetical protein NP233_g12930 [Leucocoprinus birnbaumii]
MGRIGLKKSSLSAKPRPPTAAEKRQVLFSLVNSLLSSVEADLTTCSLLSVATTPGAQESFCDRVKRRHVPPGFPEIELSGSLFPRFMSWAGQLGSVRHLPACHIPAAMAYHRNQKKAHHWSKQHFIETARLNWKAVDKASFLDAIPAYTLPSLPSNAPYPPADAWVAETTEIQDLNEHFIKVEKLHDKRDHRRPIELLDPSRLKLDIKPTESARIYDEKDGSLIGMILRDACRNEDALKFADDAVERMVETWISSRKGDPGDLPQFGLSAGSRSAMCLDWVKNLKKKATPQAAQSKDNFDSASACALTWNMIRSTAPDEVLNDYDSFLHTLGICRMDGAGLIPHDIETGKGDYTVEIPNFSFTFHGAELAPPAAVGARNYSRCVSNTFRSNKLADKRASFMHTEVQPHTYGVAWNTNRQTDPAASPVDNGGNFFLASHGVRFQASANSLLIWKPGLWHGTSLSYQDPRSLSATEYCQQGLAFVTSHRLPDAWRKYRAGLLSRLAAEELLLHHQSLPDPDELPSDSSEGHSVGEALASEQSPTPPPLSRSPTVSAFSRAQSLASDATEDAANFLQLDLSSQQPACRARKLTKRYQGDFEMPIIYAIYRAYFFLCMDLLNVGELPPNVAEAVAGFTRALEAAVNLRQDLNNTLINRKAAQEAKDAIVADLKSAGANLDNNPAVQKAAAACTAANGAYRICNERFKTFRTAARQARTCAVTVISAHGLTDVELADVDTALKNAPVAQASDVPIPSTSLGVTTGAPSSPLSSLPPSPVANDDAMDTEPTGPVPDHTPDIQMDAVAAPSSVCTGSGASNESEVQGGNSPFNLDNWITTVVDGALELVFDDQGWPIPKHPGSNYGSIVSLVQVAAGSVGNPILTLSPSRTAPHHEPDFSCGSKASSVILAPPAEVPNLSRYDLPSSQVIQAPDALTHPAPTLLPDYAPAPLPTLVPASQASDPQPASSRTNPTVSKSRSQAATMSKGKGKQKGKAAAARSGKPQVVAKSLDELRAQLQEATTQDGEELLNAGNIGHPSL